MQEQLEQRLQELKAEFKAGEKLLTELEARQMNLKSSLLRISGAIQVLEELLGPESQEALPAGGNEARPQLEAAESARH